MPVFSLHDEDTEAFLLILVPSALNICITMYMFFNMTTIPNRMIGIPSPPISHRAIMVQNTVAINEFNFSPNQLHVTPGTTVVWVNNDTIGHSVTADDGSFDTGIFAQGESASVTFNLPGTYSYHCIVHAMMKGTIIVSD